MALSLEEVRVVKDAPGLARDANAPVASAELFVVVDIPKRSTGTDANVPMRGVEQTAFRVRPNVKIVEGRQFREGQNEVIAGVAAAREFAGLDVGSRMRWGETEWEVVGIVDANLVERPAVGALQQGDRLPGRERRDAVLQLCEPVRDVRR